MVVAASSSFADTNRPRSVLSPDVDVEFPFVENTFVQGIVFPFPTLWGPLTQVDQAYPFVAVEYIAGSARNYVAVNRMHWTDTRSAGHILSESSTSVDHDDH